MAGNDEFDALIKLLRSTSAEAVPAAENAAAEVYKSAAIAAAPRKSGQLAASIKIIEGRPLKTLTGDTRQRLFVGPEKKKGYYGYFVEKGHKSAGRKRIARSAKGNTHSQKGVVSTKTIPPHPWFERAIKNADGRATQAAEAAFNAKLAELDR